MIVPSFNEELSIAKVVRGVTSRACVCDILVVDDGSADRTANFAAEAGARVVKLPFNLGIGGAVQTGYRFAEVQGYDVAVQLDGDGQHPAEEIERLIEPIVAGDADLVIGSRYFDQGRLQGNVSSLSRVVGSGVLSLAIMLLSGKRVCDPTSGFRAVGRPLIRRFAADYPIDYPEPVSLLWALTKRYAVLEIPVSMVPRAFGTSSIRSFRAIGYMIKVLWSMCLTRIYR